MVYNDLYLSDARDGFRIRLVDPDERGSTTFATFADESKELFGQLGRVAKRTHSHSADR